MPGRSLLETFGIIKQAAEPAEREAQAQREEQLKKLKVGPNHSAVSGSDHQDLSQPGTRKVKPQEGAE